MDINSEPLTLSPPTPSPAKKRNNLIKNTVLILSLVLILVSVTAHIGIIAAGIGYLLQEENEGRILLSSVLPDFSRSPQKEEEKEQSSPEAEPEAPETKEPQQQDLSTKNDHGFALKNETSYNPDLDVLYNSPDPIEKTDKLYEKYTEDAPLVLIYHTHTTEGYADTSTSGSYRSHDPEGNMLAIGKILWSVLEAEGIKSVHLTQMFDAKDFNSAYPSSSEAVAQAMATYPSIKYVIDLHRDSITDETGANISASFTYKGTEAAQMMFVVGTDEGGSGHSAWRQNLTTILHLQDMLYTAAPDSVRPINLRSASFYQDKTPGAMLVEVGSSGNTLTEAKRSAAVFGCTLAEYITGKSANISIDDMLSDLDLN